MDGDGLGGFGIGIDAEPLAGRGIGKGRGGVAPPLGRLSSQHVEQLRVPPFTAQAPIRACQPDTSSAYLL